MLFHSSFSLFFDTFYYFFSFFLFYHIFTLIRINVTTTTTVTTMFLCLKIKITKMSKIWVLSEYCTIINIHSILFQRFQRILSFLSILLFLYTFMESNLTHSEIYASMQLYSSISQFSFQICWQTVSSFSWRFFNYFNFLLSINNIV